MSDVPLDPDGQVPQKGTGGGGINIPDAIEDLLARVTAMEQWRADIEARIDTLGGNG